MHPLMVNNITDDDLENLITFLRTKPKLTQGEKVIEFEKQWSEWLGVRHSVFVNSGSSANLISLAALRQIRGTGEVIVPPLTWVSDIAAVLQNGFTPKFVDIDLDNLCMEAEDVMSNTNENTKAVFICIRHYIFCLHAKIVQIYIYKLGCKPVL
jgi:CDP-6-deoxy-D-xylo-4-hexulose-3-dehydrase